MILHFYTSFQNAIDIQLGKKASVWNKAEAHSTDIHISFDMDLYTVERKSHTIFHVQHANAEKGEDK
jgi:hypothetical protein